MRWLQIIILLLIASFAGAASLQWDASAVDEDHAAPTGYRIHRGIAPGVYDWQIDVGNVLQWPIPNDLYGSYYFAASAYNSAGSSDYSNEVFFSRDAPPVYVGATSLRASKLQQEPIMADTALYTAAIAVYDFENNANDTKGAKNLTASGTPSYSTTGEAQGTYWAGELSGAYFYRSDADFRFASDYSLSAYVNYTYVVEGAETVIASCYDSSNGTGWVIDTDGSRHIRVQHITTWSSTSAVFSTAQLSNSTRYHVALAYDDSENTVTAWVSSTSFGNILNGATAIMSVNPGVSSSARFNVGYSQVDDAHLYGYIDEVVLWSSVITSTDASAIFGARDGGTSWRDDGGAGASAVPIFGSEISSKVLFGGIVR